MSFLAGRPDNIGVKNGQLAVCSSSPNCVSSFAQEADNKHYIAPLSYSLSEAETVVGIKKALSKLSRTKIISESESYIHAEVTTLIFRFVDDLEILIDSESKLIHFRSASRVGHSDMGVNRKRVEQLKKELKALFN